MHADRSLVSAISLSLPSPIVMPRLRSNSIPLPPIPELCNSGTLAAVVVVVAAVVVHYGSAADGKESKKCKGILYGLIKLDR